MEPAVPLPPLRTAARWVFLVLVAISVLASVAGVAAWTASATELELELGVAHATLSRAGSALLGVTAALYVAACLAGVCWVYRAFHWLPPEQRYAELWRGRITPAEAALLLLVPYFHYYWMFVVGCGLADALARLRVQHPTQDEPPTKRLAVAAGICQLVLPLPFSAIVWFVFMTRVERAACGMHASPAPT